MAVGVTLAALLCFGLAGFLAALLPPFFGADERAHFSYTVTLLDGRLPEVTDRQPFTDDYPIIERSLDRAGPRPPRTQGIFVANHPPLTYLLTAPGVWAAGHIGDDDLPTLAFRLVNAASMAVGVALTGLLAGEMFPGRDRVAVGAAALTAVVPTLPAVGGYAQNDGPAFALTTACLLVGTRLLRRGLSPGRLAAASVMAGAALLTRASAAVAVAALMACTALAGWRRGGGRRAAVGGGAGAVGAALVVGAAAVVSAGWFYWRNQRLYGSPTADTFLLELLDRPHRGTVVDVLTDVSYHRSMWAGLYGVVHPRLSVWHPGVVAAAVATAVALSLAVAAAHLVRTRATGAVAAAHRTVGATGIGASGWVVMAGFCAGVVVASARFYADGGGAHPRYLLSVVPVVSALLARGLADLPCPRAALSLATGALLAVTLSQVAQFPHLVGHPEHPRPFDHPTAGLPAQAACAALGVGAGIGLFAWCWRSDDEGPAAWRPPPTGGLEPGVRARPRSVGSGGGADVGLASGHAGAGG